MLKFSEDSNAEQCFSCGACTIQLIKTFFGSVFHVSLCRATMNGLYSAQLNRSSVSDELRCGINFTLHLTA